MLLKSSVKTFWCTKHACTVLGCVAYIFNRGVDASQVNILKTTLRLGSECLGYGNISSGLATLARGIYSVITIS